jgi:type IV secretory pathway VirB4 component
MESQSTQNLIDISNIREGTIILKSGGLRQVLMVSGMNFALKSEQEQNLILGAYTNFLNSIDFPVQIIIHSRKVNIEKYLEMINKRKVQEENPLLKNQVEEYQNFVSEFVRMNAIMIKSFFAVVPYDPLQVGGAKQASGALSSLTNLLPFGQKKSAAEAEKKTSQEEEEVFQRNFFQLKQRVDRVSQGLGAIGLNVSPLNNDALIELFYNFYNPETVEQKKENLIEK